MRRIARQQREPYSCSATTMCEDRNLLRAGLPYKIVSRSPVAARLLGRLTHIWNTQPICSALEHLVAPPFPAGSLFSLLELRSAFENTHGVSSPARGSCRVKKIKTAEMTVPPSNAAEVMKQNFDHHLKRCLRIQYSKISHQLLSHFTSTWLHLRKMKPTINQEE